MKIARLLTCAFLLTVNSLHGQNPHENLIVFVGEKLYVKHVPNDKVEVTDTVTRNGKKIARTRVVVPMDGRYEAKYKVVKLVYGKYEQDTIAFTAFDHYGLPAFSRFENVLLFITRDDGTLYHEKYQFFDVYKTSDGRWASPGDPYKFDDYHRKGLKAQDITFQEKVFYDLTGYNKERIPDLFPPQHYHIVNNQAIPFMGTYVEDLFTVKKEGVLKARGIF